MSDFPSSEGPRIPWGEAVQRVPLGNTKAPGPPTAQHSQSSKKQKSFRLAANLSGSSGREKAGEDLSAHKYVVPCMARVRSIKWLGLVHEYVPSPLSLSLQQQ